jgi:alpha-tubulin suppressor-like RCC1 family protein
MELVRGRRRLTWRAGGAAVAIGMACVVARAAGPAHAAQAGGRGNGPVIVPVFNQTVIASWGANGDGQLGNGTAGADVTHAGRVSVLTSGVVQVAAGPSWGLALRSDGTVWAWGAGISGNLGYPSVGFSTIPVQVPALTNIIAVSAGINHGLALRSDGTVWAWGGNQYGQLGNGTTSTSQPTPTQVSGLTGVTKISAGGLFSLALLSNGTVWAWGYNADGELGNGTTANSSVPVAVFGASRVTRFTRITSIAAGQDSSLAVSRNSLTGGTSVLAWGSNTAGQLGDGTHTAHATPEFVNGIGAPGIAGITAGDAFSLALGTDGSVWGWGADGFSQLGNASNPSGSPQPVATIAAGSGIIQIAAGINHALALRSNGTVLAWGNNQNGGLGNGTEYTSSGPVQVTGLSGASQVAAGWGLSFALYTPPPVNA